MTARHKGTDTGMAYIEKLRAVMMMCAHFRTKHSLAAKRQSLRIYYLKSISYFRNGIKLMEHTDRSRNHQIIAAICCEFVVFLTRCIGD